MDYLEIMEIFLWIIGLLAFAGIQRIFFPHTAVNGFMDLDKLKAICPELFISKDKKKKDMQDADKRNKE